MIKKIVLGSIVFLVGIFVLFIVVGFIGVLVDPLFETDLTDGSIDGGEDTLGWLGFGIGSIFLIGGLALIAIVGKSIQILSKIRPARPKNDLRSNKFRHITKITAVGGILALVSVITLIIRLQEVSTAEDQTSPSKIEYMPNLVKSLLPEATKRLKDLKTNLDLETQDLISSRGVWAEDNWTVVSQSPSVGMSLSKNQKVCLGIVKNDETWETPKRLECWSDARKELEIVGEDHDMPLKDLLKIATSPKSLIGYHLRATVEIKMDRGNTVRLPYCTYAKVSSSSDFNLKLDATNGGDPGLFANGGQSFQAGLFLNWTGRYRYNIKKLEKSLTSKCG